VLHTLFFEFSECKKDEDEITRAMRCRLVPWGKLKFMLSKLSYLSMHETNKVNPNGEIVPARASASLTSETPHKTMARDIKYRCHYDIV